MSQQIDLDSINPPEYPDFDRDRERLRQAVSEPDALWAHAYQAMARTSEFANASREEIAAATMRAIINALP
jgi:hypothetical protein